MIGDILIQNHVDVNRIVQIGTIVFTGPVKIDDSGCISIEYILHGSAGHNEGIISALIDACQKFVQVFCQYVFCIVSDQCVVISVNGGVGFSYQIFPFDFNA
ncbi:hypothetical protein D3C80_1961510 [compost metagenome]